MKILLVNKFLYPRGGVETYMLGLGKALQEAGHTVEYFGMADHRNIVGNAYDIYADHIDFSHFSGKDMVRVFQIIYSRKNERVMTKVLEAMKPDVVHINNFNYQLTSAIIYSVDKYRRESGRKVKIVYTAHDFSLICPAHSIMNNSTGDKECSLCCNNSAISCIKYRCVKHSLSKSVLGAMESAFNKVRRAYEKIDVIVCPSNASKRYIDMHPSLRGKTQILYHFINDYDYCRELCMNNSVKEDFFLLASSLTEEKGIPFVAEAIRRLPTEHFKIAGEGPLRSAIADLPNVEILGFLEHGELLQVMRSAKAFILASRCQEVYGLVSAEAILTGTPVVAADIGGIPEVVTEGTNGLLFRCEDVKALVDKIVGLRDNNLYEMLCMGCRKTEYNRVEMYVNRLEKIYCG